MEIKIHYQRYEEDGNPIFKAEILVDGKNVAESSTEEGYEELAEDLHSLLPYHLKYVETENILKAIEWAAQNSSDCVVLVD